MNPKQKQQGAVPKRDANSIFIAAIPKFWLVICAVCYSAYVLLQLLIEAYGYTSKFMLDSE